jgi:hypothetical protein
MVDAPARVWFEKPGRSELHGQRLKVTLNERRWRVLEQKLGSRLGNGDETRVKEGMRVMAVRCKRVARVWPGVAGSV